MTTLARALGQVDRALGRLEWLIALACIVAIVVGMALGVVFRYVLNDPLIWANDLGIVCLMWLTFVGGSALYKERGHIAIAAAQALLPVAVWRWLQVAFRLTIAVAVLIIGWQLLTLIPLQNKKIIEALQIPRSAYGIPLLWATGSIAFSSLVQILDDLTRIDDAPPRQAA